MSEIWIQILTIIVSNLLVILTFFGITISLHLGMKKDIQEFHKEIKDFHGRLEKIETDYFNHVKYLHSKKEGE